MDPPRLDHRSVRNHSPSGDLVPEGEGLEMPWEELYPWIAESWP
jgi:hypothetical protein